VKLEYLPDGSPDCPLIRLFEFDQLEARRLRQLVTSLIGGDRHDVQLHNEEWIKPIGECRLNLRQADRNQGVRQVLALDFECVLSLDGWSNVEGLLEHFYGSTTSGFQWLTHDGRVALLISQSGQW
jgi:hypothetical protein